MCLCNKIGFRNLILLAAQLKKIIISLNDATLNSSVKGSFRAFLEVVCLLEAQRGNLYEVIHFDF